MTGLGDYLDDVLDAATRSQFDRHLVDCPSCRIVSETTRRTVELYKEFLPCRVSPALESRVLAAIRTRMMARHQNQGL